MLVDDLIVCFFEYLLSLSSCSFWSLLCYDCVVIPKSFFLKISGQQFENTIREKVSGDFGNALLTIGIELLFSLKNNIFRIIATLP